MRKSEKNTIKFKTRETVGENADTKYQLPLTVIHYENMPIQIYWKF